MLLDYSEKRIVQVLPQQSDDAIIHIVDDTFMAIEKHRPNYTIMEPYLLRTKDDTFSLKDNQLDKIASVCIILPVWQHLEFAEHVLIDFTKKVKSALEIIKNNSYNQLTHIVTTVRISLIDV
jgi:hypothetical protein